MSLRRKSIIILFLIISIFVLLCSPVKAEEGYSFNVEVESINKEENILKVYLKVNTQSNLLGIQGKVEYDKDVLELTEKKAMKEGWNITAFNDEDGNFLLEISDEAFFDTSKQINGEDKIIERTYKIKSKKSKTDISVKDIKFVNSDLQTINVDDTIDSITINMKKILIGVILVIIVLIVFTFCIIKKVKKK